MPDVPTTPSRRMPSTKWSLPLQGPVEPSAWSASRPAVMVSSWRNRDARHRRAHHLSVLGQQLAQGLVEALQRTVGQGDTDQGPDEALGDRGHGVGLLRRRGTVLLVDGDTADVDEHGSQFAQRMAAQLLELLGERGRDFRCDRLTLGVPSGARRRRSGRRRRWRLTRAPSHEQQPRRHDSHPDSTPPANAPDGSRPGRARHRGAVGTCVHGGGHTSKVSSSQGRVVCRARDTPAGR